MPSSSPPPVKPPFQPGACPRLANLLDWLYRQINYERSVPGCIPRYFKLDSMRNLLEELGNPQSRYRIVHVAGTKGKGSVCQMIAGGLSRSGLTTGRYSSPHIEHISERIEINGQRVSDGELADGLETVREATERMVTGTSVAGDSVNHSFFEIITATALICFARRKVEFVVLEVGLGGRLDSTNVCQPELCVITNISLDHTRQLGERVDRIAREKAGIIKPSIPVVSGATDPLASREIRETCSVHDAPLMELNDRFFCEVTGVDKRKMRLQFRTEGHFPAPSRAGESRIANGNESRRTRAETETGVDSGFSYKLEKLWLNVVGLHQAENASIAVAALKWLACSEPQITDAAIRYALGGFSLPGRCEVLNRKPLIVVDMAHNVASAGALVDTLQQLAGTRIRGCRRLIFASSEDKDLPGMLDRLLPGFDEVVFTRFLKNPRATHPEQLLELAEQWRSDPSGPIPELSLAPSPDAAWKQSRPEPDDMLCVAGSAFLVAELRSVIMHWLANPVEGPDQPAGSKVKTD